jgi:hypothetical protein
MPAPAPPIWLLSAIKIVKSQFKLERYLTAMTICGLGVESGFG